MVWQMDDRIIGTDMSRRLDARPTAWVLMIVVVGLQSLLASAPRSAGVGGSGEEYNASDAFWTRPRGERGHTKWDMAFRAQLRVPVDDAS